MMRLSAFPFSTRPFGAFFLALVCALVFAPGVQAQTADTQAVVDRLERLERDIRTLNRQISQMDGAPTANQATDPARPTDLSQPTDLSSGANPAGQSRDGGANVLPGEGPTARIFARLDALEREVRNLTGVTENLSYRMNRLGARLDKLLVDLDFRLSRLEGDNPGSFSAEARGDAAPMATTAPRPGSVTREGAMPPVNGNSSGGSVDDDGTYLPGEGENTGTLGTVPKETLDQIVAKAEGGEGGEGAPADGQSAPAASSESGQGASASASAGASASGATPETAPQTQAQAQAQAQTQAQTQAQAQPQPDLVLPEGTPQEQYRYAFDLTRQARFAEAETAFKAFVTAHPEHELADNARYWLAETYYVRKRYMDAAQAFFEAYKQAPDGNKAPDSLLKLGMSMVGLEKPQEACATFAKLRKEFTPLKTNVEQALNREVQRLDCK